MAQDPKQDPFGSAYSALIRGFKSRQAARQPPAQGVPLGLMEHGMDPVTNYIMGARQSSLQRRGIDLTDPTVDIGSAELELPEKITRNIRYALRALKGATLSPGLASPAGVERLIVEGELAPPQSTAEKVAAFAAPIIMSLIETAPLMGVGAAKTGGQLALQGPRAVYSQALSQTGEQALGRVFGSQIEGLAARAGTKAVAGEVVPRLTADQLSKAIVGIGTDVALGGAFGVSEIAGREMLEPATGEELSREDAAKFLLLNTGLAGLVGVALRPVTSWNAARAATRISAMSEGEIFPVSPGTVINGKIAVQTKNGIRYHYTPDHPSYDPQNPTKFVRVTDEDAIAVSKASVEQAKAQIEASPAAQAAKEAIQETTPARPETMPQELTSPQALSRINLIAGKYYADQAKETVHGLSQPVLKKHIDILKAITNDAGQSIAVRETAAAQVWALERAADISQGTMPGLLPIEVESAAVEMLRRLQPNIGTPAFRELLAGMKVDGQGALAERILSLVGQKLPEGQHDAIRKLVEKGAKRSRSGFKMGSRAIYQGQLVQILDDPLYGVATVKSVADEAAQPMPGVDVADLLPEPKIGRVVQLKSGQLVKVKAIKPETAEFQGNIPRTRQYAWYKWADIKETSDAKSAALKKENEYARVDNEIEIDDIIETPSTPAVTSAGEQVQVIGVGMGTVAVRTKNGIEYILPKGEIKRSAKVPLEVGEDAVSTFTAGKIPDPGNRMLYIRSAGPPVVSKATLRPSWAHVLPPEPVKGTELYAIEFPEELIRSGSYRPSATNAVQALVGKSRVASHNSPVQLTDEIVDAARVYHIPEELVAKTQRSREALASMTDAEQTAYLRNLLAMNEQVDTKVAQAATKVRRARAKAAKAMDKGDGQEFTKAQMEEASANVEALEAEMSARFNEADAATRGIVEAAVAQDKDAPARLALRAKGYNKETAEIWHKSLVETPATPEGRLDYKTYFLDHKTSDNRATIAKRSRPTVVREFEENAIRPGRAPLRPATEEYYVVNVLDSEGQTLNELRREFTNPDHVTLYLAEQGFKPELRVLASGGYVHRTNPGLVIHVTPVSKGKLLATGERIEELASEAEALDQRLAAEIGEVAPTEAQTQKLVYETIRKEFSGPDELDAWARSMDYVPQTADKYDDAAIVELFNKLPALSEDISNVSLSHLHEQLVGIMEASMRLHNTILEPIKEYAGRFAEIASRAPYEAFPGKAPFNRTIRYHIGAPTVEDLTAFARGEGADIVNELERVPKDFGFFFTRVLGAKQVASKMVREARDVSLKRALQTEWADAYMARVLHEWTADVPKPTVVGVHKPSGKVVAVSKPDLVKGQVEIRFPGTGESLTVALDEVQLSKVKDGLSYEIKGTTLEGRYADFYTKTREAPLGLGEVDQKLGLGVGVSRNEAAAVFQQRAEELADGILYDADQKVLAIDPDAADELFELYRRSQWLDDIETAEYQPSTKKQPGRITTRPKEGSVVFSDVVLQALRKINPSLEKPFRFAAYHKTKAALGDTPFAELQAKAFAGLLSEEQEQVLRVFARDVGLSQNLPPARMVVELMHRRQMDPRMANLAIYFKNEADYAKWFNDAGVTFTSGFGPTYTRNVELKIPRLDDIGGIWFTGVPFKVARRHPLSTLVLDLIYRAHAGEIRYQRRYKEFVFSLQSLPEGYKDPDFLAISELLGKYETWDEALKKGASSRYQAGFEEFRRFFADSKQDLIRHFIRRRITPIEYRGNDPSAPPEVRLAHQNIASELGLPPETVGPGAMLMPKSPDFTRLRKGELKTSPKSREFGGEVASDFTEDEIEEFLRLQREYPDAASLPRGTDDRHKKYFDFWKRWGRKNYWPLVHEGRYGALVTRNGKELVMAWSENAVDALQAVQELRDRGLIGRGEKVLVKDLSAGDVFDDVIVRYTPAGEWKRVLAALKDQTTIQPDEVQALLLRTDRPEEYGLKPGQVHAKPRERGLAPVFRDPMREIAVYNARLARMEYRWQVLKALDTLEDQQLDVALSDAYGTPRLNGQMPNLRLYMNHKLAAAMGDQGQIEKHTDKLFSYLDWLGEMPKMTLQRWFEGKEILPADAFFRKYAARKRSSELVKLQSWYRLSSVGSAFANASQFFTTTVPKFVGLGYGVKDGTNLLRSSWADGVKIFYAGHKGKELTGDLLVYSDIMDMAGMRLQPSKYLAGAGESFGDIIEGAPSKIGREGIEYWYEMARYYSMLMFNGAERTNRYGTGIAAIKHTLNKNGITDLADIPLEVREEAAAFAGRMVRETQFLYDEVSLPLLMQEMGPVGRVLFQFKPFVINMMSFEKDLMVKAFVNKDPVALKQLGTHFAMLGALGGLAGLAHHPVATLLDSTFKLATGHSVLDNMSAGHRETRRIGQTPEENFQHSVTFRADDLIYYGVPGLLGLSMGQRVGVSGQELLMSITDAPGVFGPHLSIYGDLFNMWRQYAKQSGSGAGLAGAALAAAAHSLIPAHKTEALQRLRKSPFTTTTAALVGATALSMFTDNPFREFLVNSDEGRRLLLRDTPALLRNGYLTFELMATGATKDINGRPMHIPTSDRVHEEILAALGLPGIRREEESAAIGFLSGHEDRSSAARGNFVNRIARAWADGDYEAAYQAIAEANRLGIDISDNAVNNELDAITDERFFTIQKRLPLSERFRKP